MAGVFLRLFARVRPNVGCTGNASCESRESARELFLKTSALPMGGDGPQALAPAIFLGQACRTAAFWVSCEGRKEPPFDARRNFAMLDFTRDRPDDEPLSQATKHAAPSAQVLLDAYSNAVIDGT